MANTDVLLMLAGPTASSGAETLTSYDSQYQNVSQVWQPSARGAELVSESGTLCSGLSVVLLTTNQSQGSYLTDPGTQYTYEVTLRVSANGTTFLLEQLDVGLGYYTVITSVPFSSMPSDYIISAQVKPTKVGDSTKLAQARMLIRLTKAQIPTTLPVNVKVFTYRARSLSGTVDPTRAIGVVSPQVPSTSGIASWHIDAHFYAGGVDHVMAYGLKGVTAAVNTTSKTILVTTQCYAPGYLEGQVSSYQYTIDYNADYQQFVFVGRPDRFSGLVWYIDTVKLKQSIVTGDYTYEIFYASGNSHYAPTLRAEDYTNRQIAITYYLYNRTASEKTVTARLRSTLNGGALVGSGADLRFSSATTADTGLTGGLSADISAYTKAKTVTVPAGEYRKMTYLSYLGSPLPANGASGLLSIEVKS